MKEQTDDDEKKAWCTEEFDKSDDKKKALERSISDLEKQIAEDKDAIATLTSEIAALKEGIENLNKEVAQATEQRKEEHAQFVEDFAANTAAINLIEFAKN